MHPYSTVARPAPRGPRVAGAGLTGAALFKPLQQATEQSGAQIRYGSRAVALLTDATGGVCGAEIVSLPQSSVWARWHSVLFHLAASAILTGRRVASVSQRALARLEARAGHRWTVKTRNGVILCAGGFVFNTEMMKTYAPAVAQARPLGTAGDDGSGILLGQSVGGAVGQMDRCGIWRFINPPEAFTYGILVDRQGRRICNEALYGATLGEHIAERADGHAFLVIDAAMAATAREQIRSQHGARFQKISAFINLHMNRKKAMTLDTLAARCGMSPDGLAATVEAYNTQAPKDGPDAFGKAAELCRPIRTPPFYAINCDLENAKFLTPCITMGGLRVDGRSGQVLGHDGSPIAGLYAAGRNAVGVASHSYISGLSIADCIFSGRNAGRHAATRRA
jgi:3-oxo-5alpha-steroid 4-dehydrogenase